MTETEKKITSELFELVKKLPDEDRQTLIKYGQFLILTEGLKNEN